MEIPIPHNIHPEISEETAIWKGKEDVREIIKTLCQYKKVEIVEGAVCIEHVHL